MMEGPSAGQSFLFVAPSSPFLWIDENLLDYLPLD